ncbi:MAG: PAS domain S-box protein [Candidatus Methanoperedens sp.]|nr:PAS domain S-box protein [Candidatus Methanoperedens sp.]
MPENEKLKLKALIDIASINISSDFDEILKNILKISCQAMDAHSGTIMLLDEKTDELMMVASCGLPDDYIDQMYAAAKVAGVGLISSPSGTVLKTGKYYEVPNLFEEPKCRPWYKLSKELGFTSQIFTPIMRGIKVVGLLNIYKANIHHFTEEDIDFVMLAAHQASSVVQNARMCSRLKNNVEELNEYKVHLEDKLKESHKKLFLSENYLRSIIESSFDGIIVLDENCIFEFINDSFLRITGWTKEEIIGYHLMKVMPEDRTEFILQHLNNTQKDIPDDFETRIITKNGNIKYVKSSSTITIINGEKKFVSVYKDITENKTLELALKESEAKYRDLFENANEAMYTHDLKGNFLSVNKLGLQLLGGTVEEIIGSNIKEWIAPQSYKIFEDRVRKIFLNQPLEQPVVIEVINKNGEHRWGEVTTRLIKDGDRIVGVHGISRDITEKIRLQKELKESEEKYRDLFENAQDAMYVLDNENNFLKLNTIGIQTLGCTKEEVIGSNISRWITPESMRVINERRKQRLSGEKVTPTDIIEIVAKNNEHRWVEIRTRIIRSDDRGIEIHGIARDITENRLLKLELTKSNKQQKLLCHLIQGTRGGKTRALILKHISDKSYNANQLATALNMDYKTIRHHLNVLIKNGIVGKSNDGYSDLYFISDDINFNLNG